MLVLSREKNEVIHIGESIEVTVLRIGGDKVRLGIVAPQEMKILRSELVDGDQHGSEAA